MNETTELARWLDGLRLAEIPSEVQHEGVRSLVNILGVAIRGARHPAVDRATAGYRLAAGDGTAALLGRADRMDSLGAALANGIASHVLDFDDTHTPTILHPSGPVLAAVLAVPEVRRSPGADLLVSFIAGIEIGCRAALAVYPEHYDDGWHISGTAGAIGAAAGAARGLRLGQEATAWALSLGATQAAGVQEQFGAMAKAFHVGRAGQSGLLAALLASQGFTAATTGLEGPLGWCRAATASRGHPERLTEGLGSRWEIRNNTYKPFPCGVVVHPVIDAALRLASRGLAAEAILAIELAVHPRVPVLCGKAEPRTGLEAKFSVAHSCAVALVDREVGLAQYEDGRVLDRQVAALRRRVVVQVDPNLDVDQARVAVQLAGGERVEEYVGHAVGSLDNPMSDAALDRKFLSLASPVLGPGRAASLLQRARGIGELASVEELLELARPDV